VKQTLFMIVTTLTGVVGVWVVEPFWGVAVYYLFAVLRPQFLWEWSLPDGIPWSRAVALSVLAAVLAYWFGLVTIPAREGGDGQAPRLGTPHRCVLAFACWVCLSYVLGPVHNPLMTDDLMVEYAKIFLMFTASTFLTVRFGQVWFLYVLTAVTLIYISYEMNYLYLVNGYLAIYRRGFGGLDNNGAALMLAMGAPMCLFAWEAFTRWYRWLFLLAIPLLVHAVLMSYSRGAMLSLIVACPLLWWRSRQKVKLSLFFVGIAMMIPLLAGKEIQARFLTIEQSEVDDSANQRRQSWNAAFMMANDYPIFGVGPRGANVLSHRYGADMEGRTIHSQYLQTAADNGWVGLGIYLSMFGTCWLSLRQARRRLAGRQDQTATRARALASGLEGALVVYCFGAAFLSLEVVELPYLLLFLCAQLPRVQGIAEQPAADDGASEAATSEEEDQWPAAERQTCGADV
jgi:probable O-glycosylation ligase (exosortase A-associated)